MSLVSVCLCVLCSSKNIRVHLCSFVVKTLFMSQNLSYCGELVRKVDPDRFLISLFAPASRREALWALFAFNHEIAKTREVVSETTLGLIRLQWWRDAIKDIYENGTVLEHEVVKPLAAAIAAHDLPREEFDALCYAREFDLEGVPPGDVGGLLNYLDYTNAPLLRLAVRICGGNPDTDPVQSVAVNYGLMGVLRALVHHARQGRCFMPASLLEKQGISEGELLALRKPEVLAKVVEELCGEFVPGVKADNAVLKASQALAAVYHGQMRGFGYNLLQPKAALPPAFKAMRVAVRTKFL